MICWICGNPVGAFPAYGIPSRPGRCPHCGAKPRNRAVHWYLREVVRPALGEGAELLEVGGSRVSVLHLYDKAVVGPARCTVIDRRKLGFHDLIEPPHRFIRMDVTAVAFPDNCFDVILCNNTLPYVREDRRALGEIYRCLKPEGLAMLDSSHGSGRTCTVREFRLEHPELGDDYFAENGDQWVYGEDYCERLEDAGFDVRIDVLFGDCTADFKARHGLKAHHELIVAFKSPRGPVRFPAPASMRQEPQ